MTAAFGSAMSAPSLAGNGDFGTVTPWLRSTSSSVACPVSLTARPYRRRVARASAVRTGSTEQARRIAVRAHLLDGTASDVLETVRRLGFLQVDPIATVATPQALILWSRLGPYDATELDRLLWVEKLLFEWNAFVWPIESLPLIRALMGERRHGGRAVWQQREREFLQRNRRFRTYLLGELEQHGPLLSRDLEDRCAEARREHRWYGSRKVTRMLELLHGRGEVAVAGRRGGQRMWDIAERWYPVTEKVALRGSRTRAGRAALSSARRQPCAGQVARTRRRRRRSGAGSRDAALALRSPRARPPANRGAARLSLPARDVRAAGQERVRLLRPAASRR